MGGRRLAVAPAVGFVKPADAAIKLGKGLCARESLFRTPFLVPVQGLKSQGLFVAGSFL